MKTVITIGRQFGSGGREIGVRLAKELNIPFYDKELLQKAAEESGLCEKIFDNFDEKPKSVLYSIAMDSYMFAVPGTSAGESLEQQVYLATYNTIRRIADQGPCVIIGRCADYALADHPNALKLFVSAPLETRLKNVEKREGLTPEKAKALVTRTDKRRSAYYEYYSSQKWGSVDSYDFCLDSSVFGIDGSVKLIKHIVEMKEA
jgi:cytidylate kinase